MGEGDISYEHTDGDMDRVFIRDSGVPKGFVEVRTISRNGAESNPVYVPEEIFNLDVLRQRSAPRYSVEKVKTFILRSPGWGEDPLLYTKVSDGSWYDGFGTSKSSDKIQEILSKYESRITILSTD